MQALTWAYVATVVLLLFGASIFVHEFGHFWMARRRGLKILGFSIGFGPKIFGWTRGGVDYAVRWIPAGGFVALPQMLTSQALEGQMEGAASLPPISPLSKMLVAVAGPIMNGIFALVIASAIYFLGLPELVNPAIIGGVEPGSAEAKLGIQPGDRVLSVAGQRVSSWEEVQQIVIVAPTNVLPVAIERKGVTTTYTLTATVNSRLGGKFLNLDPSGFPTVGSVVAGSAAEAAGLKPGDEVTSFAGVAVMGDQQLVDLISGHPGQACPMVVLRDSQPLQLTVTPRADGTTGKGKLGVGIGVAGTSVYEVRRPGPLPWVLVGKIAGDTFRVFGALMHPRQTQVQVSGLTGPPGILMMLAHEVKTDLRLALKFMVLLNLSLGFLNLLPLPVLDGGHIALAALEKLRGRPLNPRLQEYTTTAFAAVLISLILYISFNDVVQRFSLFRQLFHEKTRIESPSGGLNGP